MDRFIIFNGENIYEEDLLKTNLFSMIGLAKLTDCMIGNSVSFNRLPCTPTLVPSLNVLVGAGEIYQLENVDDTSYGDLPPDTTDQIVKQGILLDSVTLACPAPLTVGFSINYLIQVTYQDSDILPENRAFYNASPQVVDTVRSGVCTVAVKAGTAASTGTQTTPSPDSGYTGAYVVTVDYGQTTILSGDISVYSGAPFITEKLQDKISQTTADARYAQLAVSNTFTQPQNIPAYFASVSNTSVTVPFGGGAYDIPYPSVDIDPYGLWNPGIQQFVINKAGLYTFQCALGTIVGGNGGAAVSVKLQLLVNNTTISPLCEVNWDQADIYLLGHGWYGPLNIGDTVLVQAINTSGTHAFTTASVFSLKYEGSM